MLKTYDPNQKDVIFAGYLLKGFADGSMVSVSSEGPGFEDAVGVDGEVTRVRKHDRRHTVTVSLMQTSESNDDLSALYAADRDAANGSGVGALRIVDRSGTTIFEAAKAWIQNDPDASFEATPTAREWEIRCASLSVNHGSNPDD